MSEDVTFAAAVRVDPGAVRFRISALRFDWEPPRIVITMREWDGTAFGSRTVDASYDGAIATTLMTSLNKVNLSTRSLQQRILDRLIADGKIPSGTIAGVVD